MEDQDGQPGHAFYQGGSSHQSLPFVVHVITWSGGHEMDNLTAGDVEPVHELDGKLTSQSELTEAFGHSRNDRAHIRRERVSWIDRCPCIVAGISSGRDLGDRLGGGFRFVGLLNASQGFETRLFIPSVRGFWVRENGVGCATYAVRPDLTHPSSFSSPSTPPRISTSRRIPLRCVSNRLLSRQ